jgi:hypothetical protein
MSMTVILVEVDGATTCGVSSLRQETGLTRGVFTDISSKPAHVLALSWVHSANGYDFEALNTSFTFLTFLEVRLGLCLASEFIHGSAIFLTGTLLESWAYADGARAVESTAT